MSHTNLTEAQSLYEYLNDRLTVNEGRLVVGTVTQTELDALTRLLLFLPEIRDALHATVHEDHYKPFSSASAERALCVLNSKRPWLPRGRR